MRETLPIEEYRTSDSPVSLATAADVRSVPLLREQLDHAVATGPEPSPGSSVCVPVSPPWKGHSFEEQSEKDDVGSADVGKSGLVSDVVELVIPVDADLVVLARMTAATVASRANFDVEEIEDLRLAVDELRISLVQGGTDGRLEVRFTRNDDEVEVECVYHPIPSSQSGWNLEEALEGLSARILDALVDEHGVDDGGDIVGLGCASSGLANKPDVVPHWGFRGDVRDYRVRTVSGRAIT